MSTGSTPRRRGENGGPSGGEQWMQNEELPVGTLVESGSGSDSAAAEASDE